MPSTTPIPLPVRSVLLGVLSGGRSATPIATLAVHRDDPALRGAWQQWPMFRSEGARAALVLAALGELVVDKLPVTPSRTDPGPLLGRAVAGAIAGAAIGTLRGAEGWRTGALLGAAGAIVGSVTGRWLRSAGAAAGLPDVVVALVEDVVTVASSAAVVTAAEPQR